MTDQKPKALTMVLGWLMVCVLQAGALEFHVAPEGDDAAEGTLAAPFATPERARDAVRAVPHTGSPAVVWIHGGDYSRTGSFLLT